MRFLLRGLLASIAILALSGTYLIWNNNQSVPSPHQAQLDTALENSIQWLLKHRQHILDDGNPMLWRMLQQAGDISGDERLKTLFTDYARRYIETSPNNIWRPLFYPKSWIPVRFEDIDSLPDYNLYFVYAITCDSDLSKVPEIAAQNDPAFCDGHPFRPACVTHQMMGQLLLKRSQCGDQAKLNNSIEILQKRIRTQLTWDPRVVDVYMQRALMLVESGAGNLVKPVWLQQLLDAQQPDGGWSPFMPLIPIGGGRSIGTSRLLSIEAPRSGFHMVAQGVLLFTLLSNPQQ